MMVQVMTFEDALTDSAECSKRHLILGNGFSIACCPGIFHYGSLFKRADFSANPNLIKVFDALGTHDFEVAIRNLEAGAKLLPIYAPVAADSHQTMKSDADALKEILLFTIAYNHPNIPNEIPDKKFWACRKFLSNFLDSSRDGGQVFTLNYDLLLYWTLMHGDSPSDCIDLPMNDGFGNYEEDPNVDYVVWQGESAPHSARIHFLHGALHLFDAGNELQKFTWVRKNERLIDQSRLAIYSNKFPLFVSEGSSIQKKNKIRHNAYLYQGFKQLASNARQAGPCFFLYGHSLDKNDDHILGCLKKGKFKKLYVSLFGDPGSDSNKQVIFAAQNLAAMRGINSPMELKFYDAASAPVWG